MRASDNLPHAVFARTFSVFARWGYLVPIVSYAVAIVFIALPMAIASAFGEVTYLRPIQVSVLFVCITLILLSLIVPFFRVVNESRETLDMVADIRKTVRQDSVKVLPHSDTRQIVTFVEMHASPSVFLGFWDTNLVPRLLEVLNYKQGAFYINPRVLMTLMNSWEITCRPERMYVTDCPRDSCTVFGDSDTGERSCLIFRGNPEHNEWWSVRLDPESDYSTHLYKTYDDIYGKSATPLESRLKALVLRVVNDDRRHENAHIIDRNTFDMVSWGKVYRYAALCLKEAKRSIYAVDFSPPEVWDALTGVMCDYREAHPINICSKYKIRIHGFSDSGVSMNAMHYAQMIKRHQEIGVQLFFMPAQEIMRRNIDYGFIIVDEEVAFQSRDVRGFSDGKITLLDLQYDTDAGAAILNADEVAKLKKKFDLLFKEKRHLLSSDEFGKKFLERGREE